MKLQRLREGPGSGWKRTSHSETLRTEGREPACLTLNTRLGAPLYESDTRKRPLALRSFSFELGVGVDSELCQRTQILQAKRRCRILHLTERQAESAEIAFLSIFWSVHLRSLYFSFSSFCSSHLKQLRLSRPLRIAGPLRFRASSMTARFLPFMQFLVV
eukprot:m.272983 g.272983  ORF g.272983 m.272983 type:complete len:160 (-) comp54812_c0_seq1:491-970(-)